MSQNSSDTDRLFEELKQAAKLPHLNKTPMESLPPWQGSPPKIPNYKIEEEIHRGGQGIVFRAKQLSTNRCVALKFVLMGSFATPRQRFRFEREVDLASRLNHPNIVTIYDSGMSPVGPFCAMEFVDGKRLASLKPTVTAGRQPGRASARKGLREQLELLTKICDAVGFAHLRGVIHRDLKPANLLIDRKGEPKVLDFGLAKLASEKNLEESHPHTMTGEFLGTLAYASPEQASTESEFIDVRSDVYSLGLVIYENLTGEMPYRVDGSITETLDQIRSAEPRKPTQVSTIVDGELETILLKALSKEPSRRYDHAGALADDLRRYLANQPIDARRDSHWYVFKKTINRHRKLAFTGIAILASLLVATLISSFYYFQAARDRDLAEAAKTEEAIQRKRAIAKSELAERARSRESIARDQAEWNSYRSGIAAAEASLRMYDIEEAIRQLNSVPRRFRNLEWYLLLRQANRSLASSEFYRGILKSVALSTDGTELFVTGLGGKFYCLNAGDLKELWNLPIGAAGSAIACHPQGKYVFVGTQDGKVKVLDLQLRAFVQELDSGAECVNQLVCAKDGSFFAASCGRQARSPGKTIIVAWPKLNRLRELQGHRSAHFALAVNADGDRIATAANDIRIWDRKTGKPLTVLPGHDDWVNAISFHPKKNHRLISGGNDGLIKVWSLKSERLIQNVNGHQGFINRLRYSEDGSRAFSASSDRTIRIWDTQSWLPEDVLFGSLNGLSDLAIDSKSNRIYSSSFSGSAQSWSSLPVRKENIREADANSVNATVFAGNRNTLISAGHSGKVKLWKLGLEPVRSTELAELSSPVLSLDFANGIAVGASREGQVFAYDLERKSLQKIADLGAVPSRVLLSPEARHVFAAAGRQLCVLNGQQWGQQAFHSFDQPIRGMSMSFDGRQLAILFSDRMTIWSPQRKKEIKHWPREAPQFELENSPVAFHPQEDWLAYVHGSTNIRVCRISNPQTFFDLKDHANGVHTLTFSRDGSRLISSARDGKIKFWETEKWRCVHTVRDLQGYVHSLHLAPGNRAMAAGMLNGSLRYWDLTLIEEVP